jgi:excisionase family DNA binding protein
VIGSIDALIRSVGCTVGNVTDRPTDHLTLDEAAEVLGISREAVRLRVRRGTIRGERVDGVWWVSPFGWSPTNHVTDQPTDRPGWPGRGRGRGPSARDELVDQLRAEVEDLRTDKQYLWDMVRSQQGQIAYLTQELTEARRQLPPPTTAPPMPRSGPETAVARRKRRNWWERLLGR